MNNADTFLSTVSTHCDESFSKFDCQVIFFRRIQSFDFTTGGVCNSYTVRNSHRPGSQEPALWASQLLKILLSVIQRYDIARPKCIDHLLNVGEAYQLVQHRIDHVKPQSQFRIKCRPVRYMAIFCIIESKECNW